MQNWKPSEKQQSPELVEESDSSMPSGGLTEHPTQEDTSGDIQTKEAPSTEAVSHESVPKSKDTEPTATEPHPDLGERYEILEFLGGGGMGTVWKVHDKSLDATFAIKVIRPELMVDGKAVKRFEKEAKLACDLTHANIAAIFGPGKDAIGRPYIVMRYVEGESLAEILAREGKLSQDRAMNIFQQVWDALTHSHMKGVIHRDIKPSNVIISQTENGADLVQLVDFGIARSIYEELSKTQALTRAVEVFGSPRYMSPEQLLGQEVGPESDFYSLGCVLYEMLTGAPPFTEENPVKLVMQQLNDEPNLSNIPSKLKPTLLCCLTKKQSQRKLFLELLRRAPETLGSPIKTRIEMVVPFLLAVAPVTLFSALFTFSSPLVASLLPFLAAGILIMAVVYWAALGVINGTQSTENANYNRAEYGTFTAALGCLLLELLALTTNPTTVSIISLPAILSTALLANSKFLAKKYEKLMTFQNSNIEADILTFTAGRTIPIQLLTDVLTSLFAISLLIAVLETFIMQGNHEICPTSLSSWLLAVLIVIPPATISLEFYNTWPGNFQETKSVILKGTKRFAKAISLWLCLLIPLLVFFYQPGVEQQIGLNQNLEVTGEIRTPSKEALSYPSTFMGDFARIEAINLLRQRKSNLELQRKLCYQVINNQSYSRKNIKASAYLNLAETLTGSAKRDAIENAINTLESKDYPGHNDYRTNFWISIAGSPVSYNELIAGYMSLEMGDKELAKRALALTEKDGVEGRTQREQCEKLKRKLKEI